VQGENHPKNLEQSQKGQHHGRGKIKEISQQRRSVIEGYTLREEEMDLTGSGLCPMMGFSIDCAVSAGEGVF
jgi:hypothetical protein